MDTLKRQPLFIFNRNFIKIAETNKTKKKNNNFYTEFHSKWMFSMVLHPIVSMVSNDPAINTLEN